MQSPHDETTSAASREQTPGLGPWLVGILTSATAPLDYALLATAFIDTPPIQRGPMVRTGTVTLFLSCFVIALMLTGCDTL